MSLYPNNDRNNSTKQLNSSRNSLFPARVKDVLLSNENPLFKKTNGWVDIGTITFKPLYQSIEGDFDDSFYIAKPLFTNLKNYPLKEELVLIINSPSIELNDNPNASTYYYLPLPIGLWNSPNHNSFPDIEKYNRNPTNLDFGNTFEENEFIKSLLPEEGDFIIEGRFGNSIRLSSTTSTKKNNNNSWSSQGDNGKPIIIIRNNPQNETSPSWIPIQEDINNDGSSIYICSNQEIPIDYACKNLKSLNITISPSFNSTLQIPDNNNF